MQRVLNSERIILDEPLKGRLRVLIAEFSEPLAEIWDERGSPALFDYRDEKRETIIHFVCQKKCFELANVLLHYAYFLELSKADFYYHLEQKKFRQFVFAQNVRGESALYQCLEKLDKKIKNLKIENIIKLFFETDVIENPNDFVINKPGLQRTILHALVDKEQFKLLHHFIDIYDNDIDTNEDWGCGEFIKLDFEKLDSFNRTPLMAALETGNVDVCKLLYPKSKKYLSKEEAKRIKDCMSKQSTKI